GKNRKFIPIIFSEQDASYIPLTLQGATRYEASKNHDSLYRRLTGQPLIQMPALGSVKPMPVREKPQPLPSMERKQDFLQPWNVPYPRNRFFTGREKVLNDLREV